MRLEVFSSAPQQFQHFNLSSYEISFNVVDDVSSEATENEQDIKRNESRFEALLGEARADRQQADLDRAENARKFDSQLAEIRAQGEQIRALLSALANTNGRVDDLEAAS